MTLGAFVEVLDLTASALCSCLMAFVFIEIGAKYAIAVWLGTTILGAVFYTPLYFTLTAVSGLSYRRRIH